MLAVPGVGPVWPGRELGTRWLLPESALPASALLLAAGWNPLQIGAGFAQSPSPPAEDSAEETVDLATFGNSWDFPPFSELSLSAPGIVGSRNSSGQREKGGRHRCRWGEPRCPAPHGVGLASAPRRQSGRC